VRDDSPNRHKFGFDIGVHPHVSLIAHSCRIELHPSTGLRAYKRVDRMKLILIKLAAYAPNLRTGSVLVWRSQPAGKRADPLRSSGLRDAP
jgi:hypothetical protein